MAFALSVYRRVKLGSPVLTTVVCIVGLSLVTVPQTNSLREFSPLLERLGTPKTYVALLWNIWEWYRVFGFYLLTSALLWAVYARRHLTTTHNPP
jgi:hypothetical protein